MKITSKWFGLLGLALALGLPIAPAQAQATRTWVSGVGDDANPCSRTAPCKTFAGAISKTATAGEINVLDPGGFGAVTITKSITIRSDHFEAGVLVSGTNGIIVSLPNATDRVLLEGLDIEGLGTGLDGVKIVGNGVTRIVRCGIRGFTGSGVNVVGVAGARGYVQDSLITHNSHGINVGTTGVANSIFIQNTTMDSNTTASLQVASPSTAVLINSTFVGSAAGISAAAGSNVISYGNNVIRNGGAATQTLPLQ
jgi:hypothetical protein